MNLDGLERK